MILTDKDYDLIIKAIECAALGCSPCQSPTSYVQYDVILSKLKAHKADKLSQRKGRLGI